MLSIRIFIIYVVSIMGLLSVSFTQIKTQRSSESTYDAARMTKLQLVSCLPLGTLRVTSPYGYRIHPVTKKLDFHSGVDLAARGNLVFSILSGVVSQVGYNALLGNFIRVNHGSAISVYGHLSLILINKDDLILAGQAIAITGSTGRVTGEHLHFSVIVGGKYVNPLSFLFSLTGNLDQFIN